MEGVKEGCLHFDSDMHSHVFWLVDEIDDGAYPFKTCYGIPVSTRMYRFQKQSGSIQGLANPTSLIGTNGGTGKQRYFASLSRMACCAHFSGNTGTRIYATEHDFNNITNDLGETMHVDADGVYLCKLNASTTSSQVRMKVSSQHAPTSCASTLHTFACLGICRSKKMI